MIIRTQVLLLLLGKVVLFASLAHSGKVRSKNLKCSPFPYPFLEHGRITHSGPQKYTFHCNAGYFLASPKTVRCWKGKWSSDKKPNCVRVEGLCDDPPSIPGGKVLGDGRREGSTVQYMCDPGFLLLGKGKRSCLRGGHWSGITPSCMDESEPLQKVAGRLKDKFINKVGSYTSDSVVAEGRLLDHNSLRHGLELVILIDRSSSIDPEDFKIAIGFVEFLLRTFGVKNGNNTSGTRAAVMTFGSKVDILFNLDNDTITGPSAASRALRTIQSGGGGTAMEDAFITVFTSLSPPREKAKRALFMITDGEPNAGTVENTISFANSLKDTEGFEIFTLGVGRGINMQLLSKLASEPAISHVFVLDKYSDFKNITTTIRDISDKVNRVNPARCGYVKDTEHFLKRWPWLAAIYIGFKDKSNASRLSFCSGTLICNQWVITAAACFFQVHEINETEKILTNSTEEVFVVLGQRDLINENENQLNFYATDVKIHPGFDPFENLQNNLALVKLDSPAPMDRFRPACLPPKDRPVLLHSDLNTNASIAGWGLNPALSDDREISGGTVRFHVSNATAFVEEENVCARYSGTTSEDIFCAGSGMNTCISDLGSPIIAIDPATQLHHLIGVQSRRSNCNKGINQYAELTKYIQWIDTVTGQCQLKHYMVK